MGDSFRPAAAAPALPAGEVHVWKVDLGADGSAPVDDAVLTAEERERAARFHRAADRARATAARVALRTLLADYAGAEPAALRFTTGPHGKPALAPGFAHPAPHFNVAHSGRLVLLAFARCKVGVDVEEVRPGVDLDALAGRFFSADERGALFAASPTERERAFFRIWTRKEACLKAAGTGLGASLPAFSTTDRSGTALAFVEGMEGCAFGFLTDLEPAAGYAGAVVTTEPARATTLILAPGAPRS